MATVILDGWRLEYLGYDHKLRSARSVISEPRLNGRSLQCETIGVLHDDAGFLDLASSKPGLRDRFTGNEPAPAFGIADPPPRRSTGKSLPCETARAGPRPLHRSPQTRRREHSRPFHAFGSGAPRRGVTDPDACSNSARSEPKDKEIKGQKRHEHHEEQGPEAPSLAMA